MKFEELNAVEQDKLFMDLTETIVATVRDEMKRKGFSDTFDQATALMNVCCNIIAAEVSMMPEENRKYAIDKLVYGIIESQIPTLNDKYMNDEDYSD